MSDPHDCALPGHKVDLTGAMIIEPGRLRTGHPLRDVDGYAPPKPGGASYSEEDAAAKKAAVAELPDPGSRVGFAHYADVDPDEATEIFRRETLCVSCLSSTVCRIAAGVDQGSLTVVSRCLAYLPVGG